MSKGTLATRALPAPAAKAIEILAQDIATATRKSRSTDNNGGNHIELPTLGNGGLTRLKPGGENQTS